MNKAILMGRLGKDPELKRTQAGGAVISVSLATNEREKQGDAWVDVTEWHDVVVFGRTAELIAERCRKGEMLLVEGRIKTRKWTGQDGVEKRRTEVVAADVRFLPKQGERNEAPRGHDGGMPF